MKRNNEFFKLFNLCLSIEINQTLALMIIPDEALWISLLIRRNNDIHDICQCSSVLVDLCIMCASISNSVCAFIYINVVFHISTMIT